MKMASLLLGRQKSYFSKFSISDEERFSELLIEEEEETPFSTTRSEVPPHRRHMKKQVSFDSPPCAIKTINNNDDEPGVEENPTKEVTIRLEYNSLVHLLS